MAALLRDCSVSRKGEAKGGPRRCGNSRHWLRGTQALALPTPPLISESETLGIGSRRTPKKPRWSHLPRAAPRGSSADWPRESRRAPPGAPELVKGVLAPPGSVDGDWSEGAAGYLKEARGRDTQFSRQTKEAVVCEQRCPADPTGPSRGLRPSSGLNCGLARRWPRCRC